MLNNKKAIVFGGSGFLGSQVADYLTEAGFLVKIFDNNINSSRRVIDVSGDGRSNNGIHPMSIRDNAIDNNITINGLVILNLVL